MNCNKKIWSLHYGWLILITGTIGIFSALGLARFGYTTLLPEMQLSLGLTNEQTGLLATYNLTGYLILSLLGGALASKYGIRIVAGIGLAITGLAMILTGLGTSLSSISIWRGLTGIGSGAANMGIMGLWSAWFSKKMRGMSAGIAVSGTSFALILTGSYIPKIISIYGRNGWRISWIIFGVWTILFSILFFLIIKNKPSKLNLLPIGEKNNRIDTSNNYLDENSRFINWKNIYFSKEIWHVGIVYMAFGFSYIIYMTFFVRFLILERNFSQIEAGRLFTLLGWFSIVSGLIWGIISDKLGRKKTLIILYLIQTTSFYLFSVNNYSAILTSTILYGFTAWSIPTIMSAICGDIVGYKYAPAALGFITLLLGIGQAAGPYVAGSVADTLNSFYFTFLIAASVSFTGFLLSCFLREKRKEKNAVSEKKKCSILTSDININF